MGRSRQRPVADSHNVTQRPTLRSRQTGSLPDWSDLGVDTDDTGFDPDWWPTTPQRSARSRRPWWARPLHQEPRWTQLLRGAQLLRRISSPHLPNVASTGALAGTVVLAAIGMLLIVDRPANPTNPANSAAQDPVPPVDAGESSIGAPHATAGPLAVGGTARTSSVTPTPTPTTEPTAEVTPTRVVAGPPAPRVATRMDEPVLYWLPEIIDASDETGVPASLIAAVIRVESQGDPDAISPAGARGLMQLMPSHLEEQGIDPGLWHDPRTNIRAGALLLKWKIESTGNQWDGVRYYFGVKCDVYTCTEEYVNRVYVWRSHYAPLIAEG